MTEKYNLRNVFHKNHKIHPHKRFKQDMYEATLCVLNVYALAEPSTLNINCTPLKFLYKK